MSEKVKRIIISCLFILGILLSLLQINYSTTSFKQIFSIVQNFIPPLALFLLSDPIMTKINSLVIRNVFFSISALWFVVLIISYLSF